MFDQRQLRMNSVFYSWILAEGVILSSPDARQKAWTSEPWNATGGKSSTVLGLTLSLPDWTWKLLKNLTLLSQSCQHVYCMTILQEEFWCFVNFELFEHCVCVTEQCPPILVLSLTFTNFLTQSPVPSSSTTCDCQFQMPFETCEVIYFKNGCCADCVWYYCS